MPPIFYYTFATHIPLESNLPTQFSAKSALSYDQNSSSASPPRSKIIPEQMPFVSITEHHRHPAIVMNDWQGNRAELSLASGCVNWANNFRRKSFNACYSSGWIGVTRANEMVPPPTPNLFLLGRKLRFPLWYVFAAWNFSVFYVHSRGYFSQTLFSCVAGRKGSEEECRVARVDTAEWPARGTGTSLASVWHTYGLVHKAATARRDFREARRCSSCSDFFRVYYTHSRHRQDITGLFICTKYRSASCPREPWTRLEKGKKSCRNMISKVLLASSFEVRRVDGFWVYANVEFRKGFCQVRKIQTFILFLKNQHLFYFVESWR